MIIFKNQPTNKYYLYIFLASIIYGFFLQKIPNNFYCDWINYLNYAENSKIILKIYWYEYGKLATFSNEPLWLILNLTISFFFSPEKTIRVIIFLSASIFSFFLLKNFPKKKMSILMLFLLTNPSIVKNYLIHIRQGTAITLFLLGWFVENKPTKYIFLLSSAFVHSSFALVLVIFFINMFGQNLKLDSSFNISIFLIISVLIGISLSEIARLVHARQAEEYSFIATDVSGINFSFWITIFALMVSEGRNYVKKHAFEAGSVLLYLGTYFFVEVSMRIFESPLVLVLMAGLRLTGWRRTIFLSLFVLHYMMAWRMRLNLPLMGFGVMM